MHFTITTVGFFSFAVVGDNRSTGKNFTILNANDFDVCSLRLYFVLFPSSSLFVNIIIFQNPQGIRVQRWSKLNTKEGMCVFFSVNSVLHTYWNDTLRRKLKPKMSQSADVWLMLTPLSRHYARVGGLKLTSKLAVMACREPETDVQTLHSPSYATADVRLHFFAAK